MAPSPKIIDLPDKPPPYGVDEFLRNEWFAATMPLMNDPNPDFNDFWRGVRSTLEEQVSLTVHIRGVMIQRDFFGTNDLIVGMREVNLNGLGRNMVKWINWFIVEFKSYQFPHDWIQGWCRLFVWAVWTKEATLRGIMPREEVMARGVEKRVKVEEEVEEMVDEVEKVEEVEKVDEVEKVEEVEKADEVEKNDEVENEEKETGTETEKIPTREKVRARVKVARDTKETSKKAARVTKDISKFPKAIDPATLKFKLLVMSDDKKTEITHATIPASAALPPNTVPSRGAKYSFPLFLRAFEKELNANREDDTAIWSLAHGKIGYYMGKRLMVIEPPRQRHFEEGINWLLARPHVGEEVVLEFEFNRETSAQKKVREGTAKAKARVAAATGPVVMVSRTEDKGKGVEGEEVESPSRSTAGRLAKSPSRPTSSSPRGGPPRPVSTTPSRLSPVDASSPKKDIPARHNSPRPDASSRPARKTPSPASSSAASALKRPSIDRVKEIFTKRPSTPEGEAAGKPPSGADTKEAREATFRELNNVLDTQTYIKGQVEDEKALGEAIDDIKNAFDGGDDDQDPLEDSADWEAQEKQLEMDSDGGDDNMRPTCQESLIQELKKLGDSPALTQLQEPRNFNPKYPRWKESCAMFKMDPEDHTNGSLVRVAGLKSRLYPYQAFGTWWQMKKSRETGGGYVCDEMGLGKTLSFLAYVVVERQLAYLWNDVQASRKNKDGRHHIDENEAAAPCPTEGNREDWISCPCSTSNPASQMIPKPGVRIAIVPPPLVTTWMVEWKKHIDIADNKLLMKLAVACPAVFPLGGAPDVIDQRNAATKDKLRANKVHTDQRKKCDIDEAVFGQERILLVTTALQYKSSMETYAYETSVEDTDSKKVSYKKVKNAGIVFGIAMIDEVHEVKHDRAKNKGGILSDLPITNQPFLWGYTGTPFVFTPRGVEQILWALENRSPHTSIQGTKLSSSAWALDPVLKPYTYSKLNYICTEFDTWYKNEIAGHDLIEELGKVLSPFLEMFMLRRTAESSWFGRSLIKLKVHTHMDVALRLPMTFANELNELTTTVINPIVEATIKQRLADFEAKKDSLPSSESYMALRPSLIHLPFSTGYVKAQKLRIFASFPYLVKFALLPRGNPDHLEFDREEMRVKGVNSQVHRTVYATHLKQIVESSPKMGWLYEFLDSWLSKGEEACDGGNTRARKLIIISQFDVVALIVRLFIQRYFADRVMKDQTALILTTTAPRDRAAIITSFTEINTPVSSTTRTTARERATAKANPIAPSPIIMIGNSSTVGMGQNFTRASSLILMEPNLQFTVETQVYSRVHRIGQKARDGSESWRLFTETPYASHHKQQPFYSSQKWEWEGAVVDRSRRRKLAFGRHIQEVEEVEAVLKEVDGSNSEEEKRLAEEIERLRAEEDVALNDAAMEAIKGARGGDDDHVSKNPMPFNEGNVN
ncbi:hypothetical protein BJ875DRAFT_222131 [Amylocarpus encephaloides]|uniref:SNF2 N-terminal domain-containing protein n=1 Tax=Amylocarpus encephaloides TaxID=45428 RepID=A0A9P7YN46_9HELO|nr:hypothetical protein BJ875DRAFT_222131 [Amylocarpus encephaloides]